ncbi:hypothetical protein AB0K53_26685 [Streptomyces tuirus]|uniref:hypothetical protein n=2 Tax=Streptomyces tuirus TaxID=68278 RepID=UPI0034293CFC
MNRMQWGVAVSGWVALAATALPEGSPLRALTTAAFLLAGPGLAVTLLCMGEAFTGKPRPTVVLAAVTLTGAASLALSALAAEALFLTGTFTSTRALLVLAVLCSAMALGSAARHGKRVPLSRDEVE